LNIPECDPEVAQACRTAAAQVGDVSGLEPPQLELEEAWTVVWRIVAVEALAIHQARLSEHPELFGEDVRTRLLKGQAIAAVQHAADLQWARNWRGRLLGLFERVDVIALPTTLSVAGRVDESEMDATSRAVSAVTYPWSLAGLPALALPCGFSRAGLPISLQLIGAPGSDAALLDAAEAFQAQTDWHLRAPSLAE
jgi:aspartyl-tRNA(Asn)/glutamyl-tRNA(Gln) amidotransferase subunit A